MPREMRDARSEDRRYWQEETAKICEWATRKIHRRPPKWLVAVKMRLGARWYEDDITFIKLYRMVKHGRIQVRVKTAEDRIMMQSLCKWMILYYP